MVETQKILQDGSIDHGWFIERIAPECNGGNIPVGIAFICDEDEWIIEDGKPIRIIKKIRLVSASK
jgi:hypothetical protein